MHEQLGAAASACRISCVIPIHAADTTFLQAAVLDAVMADTTTAKQ
jgi:hypothetical protein